jgi:hypothetical protein
LWPQKKNDADPCDQNRVKIDDFIAIYAPINCALYRDKITQFADFCRFFC